MLMYSLVFDSSSLATKRARVCRYKILASITKKYACSTTVPPAHDLGGCSLHRFFTGSLRYFDVLGCLQRLTLIRPHRRQLLVNVFSPLLPLVNLCQPLTDLLELLLHLELLALSADAVKLPFVARLTLSEDQVVSVVLFERRAGRDCDES